MEARQAAWRHFRISVWVWAAWWAMLYALDMRRGAEDTALVYLLGTLLQLLAWIVVYRRPPRVPGVDRVFAALCAGLMLFIYGGLIAVALRHGRMIHCLSPQNIVLMTYISAAHVAFVALGRPVQAPSAR